jgi:hypothetical protein
VRLAWLEVSLSTEGKEETFHPNTFSPDRRGRSPVAGEPFHPYAGKYQIDSERGGGHCRSVVAPEHFWVISLPHAHTHRDIDSGNERLTRGCDSRNRANDRQDVSRQMRKLTRGRIRGNGESS